MKVSNFLFILILFALVSCQNHSSYQPDKQLTAAQQGNLLLSTVRYLGHLPKKATHATKFENQFDQYYSQLAKDFTLDAYFQKDGYEYMLASRVAPSLKVKKVATGIKMKRDANGQLVHYEEVFRTWKFELAELQEKSLTLFDKMIKGEDLTAYLPQNSKEEYIEFPNESVYFDLQARVWKQQNSGYELAKVQ